MGVIEVDSELLEQTREAGVDVERVVEQALERALAIQQREVLVDEIRRDREALAEYIAEHGNPAVELSQMFGHPCAT